MALTRPKPRPTGPRKASEPMARKPAKKSRKRTTSKARKPHAKQSPEYKVTGPYTPEQRTAIVERMKARHSPATIQGTIERPDFHVTTDIRATSDPLWRHLAAFRRRLMEGGAHTPAEWQCLLIDIRMEAHAAGLRPHLGKVEYIVATLNEAREGDPGGAWEDEPDDWSKVILTACGEAGWIQLHDLLDGFSAGRGGYSAESLRSLAIEWAESWMNARERQLAEPAAVSVSPDLLDRLQRAAAAVDPHAIDRAAERAAEKMAHALGGNGNAATKATEVVLWEGAEHNERNVRLARTRSAYLEAHGDVPAAMRALKDSGNPVARSTFYNHLDALDVAIPRWRESVQLSNPTGNLDGMRKVGTRGKSRDKVR